MTKILILKKRKEFVKVAKQGLKMVTPNLVLQAALNLSVPKEQSEAPAYLGYTVTKKVGKAHERNRAKRRLRAAAREVFPISAKSGVTYVLIGRFSTAAVDFIKLKEDMAYALKRINKNLFHESKKDEKIAGPVSDSAD